ncbi:Uncharacterised protein [uncultured archaeon]|nr:Uncharacterised protein [uncultured archaeon]
MAPDLTYIDVGRLVDNLGSFCDDLITKGPYVRSKGEKAVRGHFPLLVEETGLFDPSADVEIGKVVVEASNFQESAQLFLYDSLRGEKGVIPQCRVKLLFKNFEWGDVGLERVDHVRRFGFYWSRDLSYVLPNHWFMKCPESNIYKPVSASEIKG